MSHRFSSPAPPAGLDVRIASGAATATVTGYDGSIIATVSRHVERGRNGRDAVVVIGVDGDVDLDTAPYLRAALADAIATRTRVCLDLSRVAFFSAAGVNVILGAREHAATVGHRFGLRGVSEVTARVLAIAGLNDAAGEN